MKVHLGGNVLAMKLYCCGSTATAAALQDKLHDYADSANHDSKA